MARSSICGVTNPLEVSGVTIGGKTLLELKAQNGGSIGGPKTEPEQATKKVTKSEKGASVVVKIDPRHLKLLDRGKRNFLIYDLAIQEKVITEDDVRAKLNAKQQLQDIINKCESALIAKGALDAVH